MAKKTGKKTVKIKDVDVKDAKSVKGGSGVVRLPGNTKWSNITLK